MGSTQNSKEFVVRRQEPELVAPAAPTPYELKPLSDIDDQEGLRFQLPVIFFYKNNPSMRGKDPVNVIRQALATALVSYYPFAGRLKEGLNRKLMVECTGEGVLFIEAEADVTLDQLGDAIHPPYPSLDQILYNVPGSDGILGCPLLLIQVTRLLCGGFIVAVRLNHTMADASGVAQLFNAIAEIARGARAPSLMPVWQRDISLLNARVPPRVTCVHHEYDNDDITTNRIANIINQKQEQRSFFFGLKEMSALRNCLPLSLKDNATTFELVIACMWKCRTAALLAEGHHHPDELVRLSYITNARFRRHLRKQIPPGYYGNAFVFPAAVSKAGRLCENPLGYAVEWLKKVKAEVTEEYMRSVADFMVIKGRPTFNKIANFMVSDNTRATYDDTDLGWGKPVFAGPAAPTSVITFSMKCRNKGEDGLIVLLSLPESAMRRFEQELGKMITQEPEALCRNKKHARIMSSL